MASLFANIQELQTHLGGAVNNSVKIEHIAPYIENAYLNHLQMWIGDVIWDDIVTAHASGSMLEEEEDLVFKVQAVLAPMAYVEYSKFADIQFSGAGRFRTETEEMKTPYKYQIQAADEQMTNMAYQALERLLLFLEANKATYTDWPAAPGYALFHEALLNSALLFSQSGQRTTRYEFELVRPIIADVEQFVLIPLLTETLYIQLLENRKAGTLTALEKTLITYTYKATAHYTIEEAITRNLVQMKNGRIVQSELEEAQSYRSEMAAAPATAAPRILRHELAANRHYAAIKKFLDANVDAAEFSDYKAKVEAEAAALAAAEAETICYDAGRLGWNTCSLCAPGACSCSQKKVAKGVVRL